MGAKLHTKIFRARYLIQDYTTIGNVGDALQQMAGHPIETVEPGTSLAETLALYKFGDGGGLITDDEKATYALTNNGTVTQAAGLFGGIAGAASFNGSSQYFTQPTLLDTTPTAIAVDLWFKANDGQPSALQTLLIKINDETGGSLDQLIVYLDSTGYIKFQTYANSATLTEISSTTRLQNGPSGWYYVCVNWDSVNGMRLWVNGVLEAQNAIPQILMSSGTTRDLIIGANNFGGTIANYFSGSIAYVRIRNKTLAQHDVDVAYATRYDWTSDDSLENIDITVLAQENGDSEKLSQISWGGLEAARDIVNNKIYRYGSVFSSTDKIKLLGRI